MDLTSDRVVLQHAAEWAIVRKDVRVGGIASAIFGALALFAAVIPPFDPLLLALGGVLAVGGLWNSFNPHANGLRTLGVTFALVGAYNVASVFLEAAAGGRPGTGWAVLGVFQVIWGVQTFGRYRRFASAFESRPADADVVRAEAMIRSLRKAKPKDDPTVVDCLASGFQPKLVRARLLPDGAFVLVGNGDDVRLAARPRFDLREEQPGKGGRRRKVTLWLDGLEMKASVSAEHLERFQEWKRGATRAQPIAA
jgi:hypothetical protein